jgi:hypothetical protein
MQQSGAFFELQNISTTICSLYGYPGFEALDASGSVEPVTLYRGGSLTDDPGPHTILLLPGQVAYFGVGWGDWDAVKSTSQGCIDTTAVSSVPPNDFTALHAPAAMSRICPEGGGLPKVWISAVATKSAFGAVAP